MRRQPGIFLLLLSAVLFALVFLSVNPRTQAQLADNQPINGENGVYGPLGDWNPFPPTPSWRAEPSATPEGTPPPFEATSLPTWTPRPFILLTRQPMPSLTSLHGGATPAPMTRSPGPDNIASTVDPNAGGAITATPLPPDPPTPTPNETLLVERTPVITLTPSLTPLPTDTPSAPPATATQPVTLTPVQPTTEPTQTLGVPPIGTPSIDLFRLWPRIAVGTATAASRGQRSIEPNAVARLQTADEFGDDLNDTISGSGFMPSFINGQMGQWTGAAVASIPIDVPTGPNGQAPHLALTYSSNVIEDVYFQGGRNAPSEDTLQVAASPFGYGWSLDGIPTISRVGRVDAFSDSNNGGFVLNLGGGSIRLIRKVLDTTYSTPPPTGTPISFLKQRMLYQTYPQTFLYVARTTEQHSAKTCGYKPLYDESRWEIITTDGTHYEFGGNDNVKLTAQDDCHPVHPDDHNAVQFMTSGGSEGNNQGVLPAVWYVTRITDSHGNVMRFRYRKESMGDPYEQYSSHPWWGQYDAAVTLAEITYGGTDETQHRLKVVVVPQNYPRRDCTIAINKTGVGTIAPTPTGTRTITPTPTHTPEWEHWGCGQQLEQNKPAGYRSEYLIDRIEVHIRQNQDTGGTPTPQPAWVTIRTYNLDYAFHNRPIATPSILFAYDRAMLDTVTLSDGDIAQATPVPTAVPTGATSTASPRPATLTPAPAAQKSFPPYTMTYHTTDNTKINWLPLKSIDNGYGGKTEYTYVSTPTPVSCWNAAQNRNNSHGRLPASSMKYYEDGTSVSTSSYTYEAGACSEKFSTGTEGKNGNWYEFLGFGTVSETLTDHTQTGTPVVSQFTTTKYYRCRGEGTPGTDACAEATPTGTTTPGNYTGAEPHPSKGEVLLQQVRAQATTDAVELEEQYEYNDGDLVVGYIGYSTSSTSTAPWGRLTKSTTRRYGRTTLGVGTPSASVASVTTYEYNTAQQQDKQWGNVTRRLDYLSEADYTNNSPYRAERVWYNTRETINASDFSPSQSAFIVDRPRFRAVLADAGALPSDNPTPVATAEVANIEWFTYDDNAKPTDGLDPQGALAQHVTLEKISAFPSGLDATFLSNCTGVVDRFRTINKGYTYTVSGGAGNVASETTYTGYGYACVVNPFSGSDTIYIDPSTPRDARTTTKAYDDVFHGLITSITNPLSYVTTFKYFGINSTANTGTEGYFTGQLHKAIDANGNETALAYDRLGRKIKVVSPGDSLDSPTMAFGYSDNKFSPAFPSVQSTWTKREASGSPWSDKGIWERSFVDGRGQVVEIQKPHYNWTGNPAAPTPTGTVLASGNDVVVHRTYDALGNLIAETNPYLKAAYGSSPVTPPANTGTPPITPNPYSTPVSNEYRSRTTYDVAGRPLVVTKPDNTTIQHHYGVVSAATQSPGFWIDDLMNEEQHRRQTRTDSLGRIVEVREYNGDCGAMGFSCGTPHPTTWDTDSAAIRVEYEYGVEDELLAVLEPGGNQTAIEYDLFGRKVSITDPDLGTWTYVYDAVDNIAHQVDARNQTVCHFYDGLDRETQRRYISAPAATPSPCMVNQGTGTPTPAGTAGPIFAYGTGTNEKGHRTSSTLVDGSWYMWEYDARGRIKKETQYVTGYDNSGANGAGSYTTEYTFKSNGDAASLKHPDTLDTLNITYNSGGSDVVQSAPTTQSPGHADQYFVSQTKYTADGRVDWRVLGPTATAVIQDSDYNAVDLRLYRIRAGTVASAPHYKEFMDQYYDYNGLGYDDAGNPLVIDDWVSGAPQKQTLTYDDRDRLTKADATGNGGGWGDYGPETYQYDRRGNIIHRSVVALGTTVPLTYSYHAAKIHAVRKVYSDATATPTASGPTPTITPTPASGTPAVLPNKSIAIRLKRPSSCAYDVDIIMDVLLNDSSVGFRTATVTTSWIEFLIAQNLPMTGNDIISIGFDNQESSNYHLGANCEVLIDWVKVNGVTIPAEGGRFAFDVGNYGFPYAESEAQDGEGVIAPPEGSSSGDSYLKIGELGALRLAVGAQAGAYEYDANGNMYWRIVESNAYNFIYDGENRLAEVKKDEAAGAAGVIEAAFTYDGDGRRIKAKHGSSMAFYVGDLYEYTESNCPSSCGKSDVVSYYMANGERVALYQGSGWLGRDLFWSLADHLGSTTRTIWASARVVRSDTRYKAWGSDRYYSGGSGQLSSRQYTGQHEEPTIGLYYYNARYYDPGIGRFVSADSMVPDPGSSVSLNRYAYADNNPTRYNDPSGHFCVPCAAGIAAAVGLGFTTRSSAGPNPGNSHDGPGLAKIGAALLLGDLNDYSVLLSGYDIVDGRRASPSERKETLGLNLLMAAVPVASGSLLHVVRGDARPVLQGAESAVEALAEGGVYALRDPVSGKVMRTGRSKSLWNRMKQHGRTPELSEYEFSVLARTDDYAEQRGLEQLAHEEYNPPLNRINGISPLNKNRDAYMDAAQRFLYNQQTRQ